LGKKVFLGVLIESFIKNGRDFEISKGNIKNEEKEKGIE